MRVLSANSLFNNSTMSFLSCSNFSRRLSNSCSFCRSSLWIRVFSLEKLAASRDFCSSNARCSISICRSNLQYVWPHTTCWKMECMHFGHIYIRIRETLSVTRQTKLAMRYSMQRALTLKALIPFSDCIPLLFNRRLPVLSVRISDSHFNRFMLLARLFHSIQYLLLMLALQLVNFFLVIVGHSVNFLFEALHC